LLLLSRKKLVEWKFESLQFLELGLPKKIGSCFVVVVVVVVAAASS